MNNWNETPEKSLWIKELNSYFTREKFILWWMILPIFFLGLHLGAIGTHITLNFSFTFPLIIRVTGIITSLWVLSGIYLYAKNY